MPTYIDIILLFILFFIELFYFKIADKYNISDHPNHRSSHTRVTIRGGGIIFTIALVLEAFCLKWTYGYFITGLVLISLISFIDDIQPASKKIRFLFHIVSVGLLFYQLDIYNLSCYWLFLGFIIALGTINAINFMDGINGITGGIGLVTMLTLYYINKHIILFTEKQYLIAAIMALLVFNFFNFRTKAKCFAGDVGSVSLAFIIVFFLLQLTIRANNFNYLLLLLIYGLDTTTTILFRIIRKENIFEAHRSHFYQFLVNEKKIPHLMVAILYIFIQAAINLIIMNFFFEYRINLVLLVTVTTLVFIFIRIIVEGSHKLFNVKR